MKLSYVLALLGIVSIAFQVNPVAQEIQYSELSEKLTFDRTPIENREGMIASFAPVLKNATPAVVTVFAKSDPVRNTRGGSRDPREEMLRRLFGLEAPETPGRQGLGSGVIISPDGYILTNNHVVQGADRITVNLKDSKREYSAEVVGADADTDVALIKIKAQNLQPIVIGDSSLVEVGDVVLAVGNPLGLEQSVTHGIVSALGRKTLGITGRGGYENFIQTDASINVGNSGGALIDTNGRLIGLNTAIKTADFSRGNVGIAFAIPSNMALNIVRKLLDGGGKVRRGFLGVGLDEISDEMARALGRTNLKGALVREVNDGTPAAIAGLAAGDLIIRFDGKPVNDPAQLRLDISSKDPGTEVNFTLIRKGKQREVSVILGDKDELLSKIQGMPGRGSLPQPAGNFIEGVGVRDLDDNLRGALGLESTVGGIFVESVDEDSAAAEAGLTAGQVITQVDQKNVLSVDEARDIVSSFDGEVILIQVYENGRRSILAVRMR